MISIFPHTWCMELYDKHFRCMEVNPGFNKSKMVHFCFPDTFSEILHVIACIYDEVHFGLHCLARRESSTQVQDYLELPVLKGAWFVHAHSSPRSRHRRVPVSTYSTDEKLDESQQGSWKYHNHASVMLPTDTYLNLLGWLGWNFTSLLFEHHRLWINYFSKKRLRLNVMLDNVKSITDSIL